MDDAERKFDPVQPQLWILVWGVTGGPIWRRACTRSRTSDRSIVFNPAVFTDRPGLGLTE